MYVRRYIHTYIHMYVRTYVRTYVKHIIPIFYCSVSSSNNDVLTSAIAFVFWIRLFQFCSDTFGKMPILQYVHTTPCHTACTSIGTVVVLSQMSECLGQANYQNGPTIPDC